MVFAVELEYIRDNFYQETQETNTTDLFQYNMTCLGGTFDHMHLGHRMLLSQACLYTRSKILIGITSEALLSKKAYAEYLEPYETRKASAVDFLKMLNPHLEVEVFELSDPVGVADKYEDLEAVILTREVEKGGQMINDARAKVNMKPLDMVFVDMILSEVGSQENFSNKTSSTRIREFLAKHSPKK